MEQSLETKILFVGLDGSGKSTIIAKLKDPKNEEIMEIFPTPFLNCTRITFDDRKLNLVEISGLVRMISINNIIQKRYRDCWKMFYEEVQGIVFVIDSTDISRIRIVKELIQKMDEDLPRPMPIAFLVNKQDLERSMTNDQVRECIDVDHVDSNFTWKIIQCVAYTGLGLTEGINFLLSQIV